MLLLAIPGIRAVQSFSAFRLFDLWKMSVVVLASVLSSGEAESDTAEWKPAAFRSVSRERRTEVLRLARLLDQLNHLSLSASVVM